MNELTKLTGLQVQNGLNFTGAINDFNYVTWLSGITLKNLKQVPEELKDIPKDIQQGLNQITTNFCNLFSKKENLEITSKKLENIGLIGAETSQKIGLSSLDSSKTVLMRSQYWTVGGLVFDGVLQCEHTSESKPTDYLVQSGAIMSDHMINQPITVSMSIIMSDITPEALEAINFAESETTIAEVRKQLESSENIQNWMTFSNPLSSENNNSSSRSINMFKILKGIQLANYPLEITTRLYNYKNMVIIGLSAVENAESFNGLVCNIQFREIMVAGLPERVICKRVLDETKQMQGGNLQASQITNGQTIFGDLGINKNTPGVNALNNIFPSKGVTNNG